MILNGIVCLKVGAYAVLNTHTHTQQKQPKPKRMSAVNPPEIIQNQLSLRGDHTKYLPLKPTSIFLPLPGWIPTKRLGNKYRFDDEIVLRCQQLRPTKYFHNQLI